MSSAFFMRTKPFKVLDTWMDNVELVQWATQAISFLNDYAVDLRDNEDHDRASVVEKFIEELEGGT